MLANSSLSLSLSLSPLPREKDPTPPNLLKTMPSSSTSRPNGVVPHHPNSSSSEQKQKQNRMKRLTPREFFQSVASNIASQPAPKCSDPHAWGVLTAISNNARKRTQGINIFLTADEHCIGRSVDNLHFRVDSISISANHCKICRTRATNENMEGTMSIFLKDTSSNWTYLNWEKLKKDNAAFKVRHGDIISLGPSDIGLAFAFVYREMLAPAPMPNNAVPKRKAEEVGSVTKRLKVLGIGAPEGPASLDDFRSLQRSNTELKKQLENQAVLIDTLRSENRTAVKKHENELKSVKESVAKCYLGQLKELQLMVDRKSKELGEANRASAEQKHVLKTLNERLSACMQSCAEANAIKSSQKANIAELKEQLDVEKTKRKEEQEKAADDLKVAVHRAQSGAQEKLKRLADAALRREREVQETMNKLQESKRESSLLVEALRSKLEDTRQKLVISDNKVRHLETQVHEEQLASANGINGGVEHEQETRNLWKELESEKVAREEAWAKVSVLELEINAAMQDLNFERQRLKGARERLMLRETQLRVFYSTTEEIQLLFAKQQEQLKAMQRTLEDEENYENTSVDMNGVIGRTSARGKEAAGYHSTFAAKAGSVAKKLIRDQVEISSDEASVTEKHDCGVRSEECQNTQEAEFTSAYHDHGFSGGFGSPIDVVVMEPMIEGDAVGTERVLETESPANCGGGDSDLSKCDALAGDTMRFDDKYVNVRGTEEHAQTTCREVLHHSQSNNPIDTRKTNDDTQVGETIRTTDLVTSEVGSSWACNLGPSKHGGNESPRSRYQNAGSAALRYLNCMVAECQNTPSDAPCTRHNDERRAPNEAIGIVCISDSETESCSETGSDHIADAKGGSMSDAETLGGDRVEEDPKQDETLDENDEATQEDSVG